MTNHGDYLRRLRDQIHELQVLVDEAISETDRVEDAALNANLDSLIYGKTLTLRSVADLRDDEEQARAEDYLLRGGA